MAKKHRNPDRFNKLRGEVKWGLCQLCGMEYPEKHMLVQEGYDICIDDYEPNGMQIGRERERASAAHVVSAAMSRVTPPRFSNTSINPRPPAVTRLDPGILELSPGGASATLELTGTNLSSDDTLDYGYSELVDASAPVFTATLVTLEIEANAGATPGYYDLTYNGQVFRKAFRVLG